MLSSAAVLAQSATERKFSIGESYENNGSIESAERLYLEVFDENPSNSKYFWALARVMTGQNKYGELLPHIEKHIEKKGFDSKLFAFYGETLWRLGENVKANGAWNEAVRRDPKNRSVYELIADAQTRLRLIDKAIETYETARKNFGNSNIFTRELCKLHIARGDYESGVDEAIRFHKNRPRELNATQGLIYALMLNKNAVYYIKNKLWELAENRKEYNDYLLYIWYLRTINEFDEAFSIAVKIDEKSNRNGSYLLSFANECRSDGQYAAAGKAYRYLLENAKSKRVVPSALFGLARTLELQLFENKNLDDREIADLIARYESVVSDYPNEQIAAESRLRIAELAINYKGDFDMAKKNLKELIISSPSGGSYDAPALYSAKATNMLGDIYLMEGDLDAAWKTFDELIDDFKPVPDEQAEYAEFMKAEILFYRGLIDSSLVQYYKIAQDVDASSSNDALSRSMLIETNKELTKALSIFAKAQYEHFRKNTNKALALYQEVAQITEDSDLWERSLIEIAKIKIDSANYAAARKNLSRIFEKNPKTIYGDYVFLLEGRSFEAESKSGAARESYSKILVDYPNSIYLDEARKKIRKLRGEPNF